MTLTHDMRVTERTMLSADTCALTLESLSTPLDRLDALGAGAHVDLHLQGGLVRQYSAVAWSPQGDRVTIAVKVEPDGRGGSRAVHALDVGDVVAVGGPRNHFPVTAGPGPVVLIGGGIGITPILAMARSLAASGSPADVHYLVRERSQAALDPYFRELDLGRRYHLHCDDEHGRVAVPALVAAYPADARFHVCGPEPLLDAVQQASARLGIGTVHVERFGAAPLPATATERSFEVHLARSGESHRVPADESVLAVLCRAGHDIAWSCTEGVCGSCLTDVLEGEVDHRDSILTDDERDAGDCMCVCVSRARGARLVLDL